MEHQAFKRFLVRKHEEGYNLSVVIQDSQFA